MAEGPTEQVRHSSAAEASTGPGGTPRVKVTVSAEVSGEWVTAEVIAATIHQLADTLAARLRGSVPDG